MIRRKLSSLLIAGTCALALASCGKKRTLLFLNWGEYIDETLIDAFEEEYNCTVNMDLGDSNEIFYSKVRGGTTVYDVVCPSDYMVEKMYANDMLQKIDFTRLTKSGYNPYSDNVRAGVKSIFNDMDQNLKSQLGSEYTSGTIQEYAVPYLWGTWGIMYTTSKEGVKNYYDGLSASTDSNVNQWAGLFDRSVLPAGTRVAMYDSHQHAYYAASRYFEKASPLSVDYGVELSKSDLGKMQTLIETMNYDAWGTDNIKKDIVAGNIDVGFMWTGDFLYYYAENAANVTMDAYLAGDVDETTFATMMEVLCDSSQRVYSANGNDYEIGFDCYIPDDTVAFCDNLVITKDAANVDLAYEFIDFMSSYEGSDPDSYGPHYTNTYYVDYDATTIDIYDDLVGLSDYEFSSSDIDDFKEAAKDRDFDAYDSDLYWVFYDYVIGLSFDKYYPKDTTKGTILATFKRNYINQINATFNNARA